MYVVLLKYLFIQGFARCQRAFLALSPDSIKGGCEAARDSCGSARDWRGPADFVVDSAVSGEVARGSSRASSAGGNLMEFAQAAEAGRGKAHCRKRGAKRSSARERRGSRREERARRKERARRAERPRRCGALRLSLGAGGARDAALLKSRCSDLQLTARCCQRPVRGTL